MNDRVRRRNAWGFGLFGETIARWALRFKGHQILASRFKTPIGEIDLISRASGTIIFTEVKSRRQKAWLDQPISPKQQRRIERAALTFIQRNPAFSDHDMRFDLIIVRPWSLPTHIPGAWRYGD